MSKNSDFEKDNSDDTYEDSFFDDAIIEIANEIALIKATNLTSSSKSDPQVALKNDMELKNNKSSPINFFQVLKTLQEVQISSGNVPAAVQGTQSNPERTYEHLSKGSDQKYHPLTITETVIEKKARSCPQSITLEDLFEDPEPEEQIFEVVPIKNKPLGTLAEISDSDNLRESHSIIAISNNDAIKTINIPDMISKNIVRDLKEHEKMMFRNFLKKQK